MTSAVILGMIVTMFTEAQERTRAISLYSFVAAAGASIGLLAGGVLTELLDWHWIFFVNVPIGIVTAHPGRAPDQGRRRPGARQGGGRPRRDPGDRCPDARRLRDRRGARRTAGRSAAHAGLRLGRRASALAAFLALEARLENPILPLRLLRMRTPGGLERRARDDGHRACTGASSWAPSTSSACRATARVADRARRSCRWTLVVAALSVGPTANLVRRFGAGRPLLAGLVDHGRRPARALDRRRRRPATSRRCSWPSCSWASAPGRRSCRC